MQYYVHTAGKTIGPHSESDILSALAVGDIDASAQIQSVEGGEWRPVNSIRSVPAASKKQYPAAAFPAESIPVQQSKRFQLPSKAYLRDVRATSCYQALRTVIELAAYLLIAGALLAGVVGAISMLFVTADGRGDRVSGVMGALLSVAAGAIAAFLFFAVRQSALLVIDIADTLLAHHAAAASPSEDK